MSVLDKIWIKFTSKFIAEDKLGNKYYESSKKNSIGKNIRYVTYSANTPDPSSIQPVFHGWLHYMTEEIEIPVKSESFPWQIEHSNNLTGTKHAYNPLKHSAKRAEVSSDYQPFQPNKELL